jgi:aldose sugar dehydrogenase
MSKYPTRVSDLEDRLLRDRAADNREKFDITESEALLAGRNFGIDVDIHTGPNGNLFVAPLDRGQILEVFSNRDE